METQNLKEDVCVICGKKVYRETDSKDIFCGDIDCLHQYANQIECSKCGTPTTEFGKNGIGMGRVTLWTLSCPKHPEIQFKRYSFCPDVETCPKCKQEVVGEIGLGFLRDEGKCLSCDHIQGDI